MEEYALPQKVMSALRRLFRFYNNEGENLLRDIIEASHVYIDIAASYDNWNGGTYGHAVILFVSSNVIDSIDLNKQDQILDRLEKDLRKAVPKIENEYISIVSIQEIDESDSQFQASIPFSNEPIARPEDVGLWRENSLRLFISHRDRHKVIARELSDSLEAYGISAFVAHDAIKPMREWQQEIMNGLMTMEVLLVLLTDDFHESEWTNQEVGYALGKGIPIVCVKVGSIDPKGFIASRQALKAPYNNMYEAASLIQRTLLNEIGQASRLKEILIGAFISSQSYIDAMKNLSRLTETTDKLTDAEFERIVKGYEKNDQLYTCAGIHNKNNWFKRYLQDTTGKELVFEGNKISEVKQNPFEEIPF